MDWNILRHERLLSRMLQTEESIRETKEFLEYGEQFARFCSDTMLNKADHDSLPDLSSPTTYSLSESLSESLSALSSSGSGFLVSSSSMTIQLEAPQLKMRKLTYAPVTQDLLSSIHFGVSKNDLPSSIRFGVSKNMMGRSEKNGITNITANEIHPSFYSFNTIKSIPTQHNKIEQGSRSPPPTITTTTTSIDTTKNNVTPNFDTLTKDYENFPTLLPSNVFSDYGEKKPRIQPLKKKRKKRSAKYSCSYPGCTKVYTAKYSLKRHGKKTYWGTILLL